MYNVRLISGLFEEGEMLCICDDILLKMQPLIDPYLAKVIQQSLDEFDASGVSNETDAIARKLTAGFKHTREVLGETLDKLLFADQVKARGLFDVFKTYSAEKPYAGILDLDEFQDNLNWLMANQHKWVACTPKRDKQAFSDFVNACDRFEIHVTGTVDKITSMVPGLEIPHVENLRKILLRNSALFYDPNERVTFTGMQWCESHESDIEAMRRGVDFVNYKNDKGLTQLAWRSLVL